MMTIIFFHISAPQSTTWSLSNHTYTNRVGILWLIHQEVIAIKYFNDKKLVCVFFLDDRYEFRQEHHPTVSKLVRPSDDFYANDRHYPHTITQRQDDNRYTTDLRQRGDDQYTRRVPTADILIDPIRRPAHGNAPRCVMEVNIEVSIGGNRHSQSSFVTNHVSSKPPTIRSTAVIDNARYIDLNFRSPENTAQIATDGIIRRSPSQGSTGFHN